MVAKEEFVRVKCNIRVRITKTQGTHNRSFSIFKGTKIKTLIKSSWKP